MRIATINPNLYFKWLPDEVALAAELVEAEVGFTLPRDYRAFVALQRSLVLGNFIGATTYATRVRWELGSLVRERLAHVGVVYSVARALSHYHCFARPMQLYDIGPRIPEQMFPIAHDNGRGWYLMQLTAEGHGTIWYWERQDIRFGLSSNRFLAWVAPSFEAFIASITTPEGVERELAATR